MPSINSSTLHGIDGKHIEVEVYFSNHLPSFQIIGLANREVDESRERIRSAFASTGIDFPRKRIVANLSPADLPKKGSSLDLAIAVAILQKLGGMKIDTSSHLFVGELGLDGVLKPIKGLLSHIEAANSIKADKIVFPLGNLPEASLGRNIKLIPMKSLKEVLQYLFTAKAPPCDVPELQQPKRTTLSYPNIKQQAEAKLAITLAAAGGHNLMLEGPPGGGKTVIANALIDLMPEMEQNEIHQTTKIHSVHNNDTKAVTSRPFRSPHHSASHTAIVGGGTNARPGEITLAHNGVLFLDELAEFDRRSLESLRQPLEDGSITLSRVNYKLTYPADFVLVCTQNPCPCGNYLSSKSCNCSFQAINRYQNKISGPLLDRIDLYCFVQPTKHKNLLVDKITDDINVVIKAINSARRVQMDRQGKLNSKLTSNEINSLLKISTQPKRLLLSSAEKLKLSSRSFLKLIKVTQTIADLDQSHISEKHVLKALKFRKT